MEKTFLFSDVFVVILSLGLVSGCQTPPLVTSPRRKTSGVTLGANIRLSSPAEYDSRGLER